MGLDMYLTARRKLYNFKDEEKKKAEEVRKLFPDMFKSGNLNTTGVSFEVGYWRKANAIHKWFVDNCQEGVDNCQGHYVGREKLIELKELCKKILKEHTQEIAEELMPVEQGFFFGTYEYDEWYWGSLEETIKIINKCLELPEDWNFEYCSSW